MHSGKFTMGFFGSLFEKRQCSICGKEMGLTERKELSGGNLCDDCAEKLSDWFSTEARKASTPQQIKEHLAYREQNRQAVAQFRATRTIGKSTKVYLDEMNRKFMVSSASDLQKDNPDVIDASAITNVAVDINESKHELRTKDEEGRSVSYNPPRYDFSYDFYVDIDVSHPHCSHRRIKVNGSSVWVRYDYLQARGLSNFGNRTMGNSFNAGGNMNNMGNMGAAAGIIGAVINGIQNSMNANNPAAMYPPEYQENMAIAEDIRVSLLNLRNPGSAVPNPGMGMGANVPDRCLRRVIRSRVIPDRCLRRVIRSRVIPDRCHNRAIRSRVTPDRCRNRAIRSRVTPDRCRNRAIRSRVIPDRCHNRAIRSRQMALGPALTVERRIRVSSAQVAVRRSSNKNIDLTVRKKVISDCV